MVNPRIAIKKRQPFGPAKIWLRSGGPLQTRPYDLDGRQTSYPYTSSGTRAKTDGYDGPRPVASLGLPRADSNRTGHTVHNPGALITETIYLNDTPIAAIKTAGVYLIQADRLNTPRAILEASNGAPPVFKRLVACADSKNKSRALLRFLKLPSCSQIELNQRP